MCSSDLDDPEAEDAMAILMEAIRAIRNIRSEMNVPPNKKIEAIIVADSVTGTIIETNRELVMGLSGLSGMTVKERLDIRPEKAVSQIISGAEIYVPLVGIVDLDVEIQKLEKDLDATRTAASRSRKKLSNKGFLEKAAEDIVEKERGKLAEFEEKEERLVKRLGELRE